MESWSSLDLLPQKPSSTACLGCSFAQQADNAKYQFSESVQYLQEIGALDESGEKKVRIANYLQGPSNCIASSSYYSICCLSECEGLVNELEATVQAPAADPAYLLELVGHISSASVDAPRQLPFGLKRRLQDIADHNGGQVPLHGRLFAEWMHYAFPHECPYPKVFQESKILTPEFWAQKKMSVDAQERLEIASSAVLETPRTRTALAQSQRQRLLGAARSCCMPRTPRCGSTAVPAQRCVAPCS